MCSIYLQCKRYLINFIQINTTEENKADKSSPHSHMCFLTYYCKSSFPPYSEVASFQVTFLPGITKYKMCKELTCCSMRNIWENLDTECNFKFIESTCCVHSGFVSTALGLANVVLYFNMEQNNNNSSA